MRKKLVPLMNTSLSDVTRLYVDGRIDAQTLVAYRRVWQWCAPRFESEHGLLHDAFEMRYGRDAYKAKIDKTRKAFGFAPIYS